MLKPLQRDWPLLFKIFHKSEDVSSVDQFLVCGILREPLKVLKGTKLKPRWCSLSTESPLWSRINLVSLHSSLIPQKRNWISTLFVHFQGVCDFRLNLTKFKEIQCYKNWSYCLKNRYSFNKIITRKISTSRHSKQMDLENPKFRWSGIMPFHKTNKIPLRMLTFDSFEPKSN